MAETVSPEIKKVMQRRRICVENLTFCIIGSAMGNSVMQAMMVKVPRTISHALDNIKVCMKAGKDVKMVPSILRQGGSMLNHKVTRFCMTIKLKIIVVLLLTSLSTAKDTMAVIG